MRHICGVYTSARAIAVLCVTITPINFVDPLGLWMDGDEKLSQGAQTYTKYYGEKWEEEKSKYDAYVASGDVVGAEIAQINMEKYHKKADDIRMLDADGKVTGRTLNVPVYNQFNTAPMDGTNQLCWATSDAMMASFYLGDTIDRTLAIATGVAGSTLIDDYNVPRAWQSTAGLGLGITDSQIQNGGILTESQIQITIDSGNPFGVLYGNTYLDSTGALEWSGHWVVGIGFASAPGHDSLVVSNDPAGGVQRIQTYNDFRGNYVGDSTPWRPWAETAK